MNVSLNHEEVKSIPNGEAYYHRLPNRTMRRAAERISLGTNNNRKLTKGRLTAIFSVYGNTAGVIKLNGRTFNRSMRRIA